MDRLIGFTCHHCKEDFTIRPYFDTPCVHTHQEPLAIKEYYSAQVTARAICPYCGTVNELWCEGTIYSSDIIDLATRKYTRN